MFTFQSDRSDFVRTVRILQELAHANSKEKGFWDGPDNQSIPTKLCLMHSEVSEWLEAYWKGNPPCEKPIDVLDRTTGEVRRIRSDEEEAADILVRLLDLCQWVGIDLATVALAKMGYNKDRPPMHGGKKC